ncbi:C-type lectin domain family 4 member M-like [Podarcis raffonei]|uniref:C-type lectin domain family 4 member M-like n=1 Tax=Podarcis raffonei TaxID=65483 RepID=UPI0023295580|nr:C-type lectin domain family 4 member M-like [Podarcis raffonei]
MAEGVAVCGTEGRHQLPLQEQQPRPSHGENLWGVAAERMEEPAAAEPAPAEPPTLLGAAPPATITDDATERMEKSGIDEAPRKDSAAAATPPTTGTHASTFRDMVTFLKSPAGERYIILEIFILAAMTLLLFLLYQKELKRRMEFQMAIDIIRTFVVGLDTIHEDKDDQKELKNREEFQMAMTMIRNFVVGIDSTYKDKDDFQILAAAHNISEEMVYYANINDQLQKEIDILTRNLNDGWVLYSRAFYFFSLELRTWVDSQRKCEREGAKLISMQTKEEQYFINKEVKFRKMVFWIGLFKNTERTWTWHSGSKPATTYWNYYEPNGQPGHDCAAMSFDCYYDRCWMALQCERRIQYICKKVPDDTWL